MSRTLSAAMAGHLATRSHTRCNMLLLDLRDGASLGFTDHDKELSFDIGDGVENYQAGTGIFTSNVSLSCGLDADNYEVSGPIGDIVALASILGGRFDRARARLFEVNWKRLTDGAIKILAGNVCDVRAEGGKFILEIRSDMDRYNSTVGRLITNNCDADFGDARCGATPTTVEGTVTAVTDAMRFAVSYVGAHADNFFNLGSVVGLTGDNTGSTREIFDWSLAGAIELFAPLAVTPAVGDTFTVKNGCSKMRKSDDVSVPTCLSHNNVINFRGYPEVPGRKVMQPAIPGQGSDGA